MKLNNRIITNIFSNGMATCVNFALSFFLAPIVVHGLGNTWYGVWIILMQISNYLWLLDFGIRESVVRYVSKHYTERDYMALNNVVSTAFYLYLLVAGLTLVICILLSKYFGMIFNVDAEIFQTAKWLVVVIGINIAQNWLFNSYNGILVGLQRFDLMNVISVSANVIRFLIVICIIKMGYGIIALSLIILFNNLASNIATYIICKRLIPQLEIISYDRRQMRFNSIGKFSLFVFINNIATKIIFLTDSIVIGMFLPMSAVTYYSIPAMLVDYARNILRSMTQVLYPLTSMYDARNEKKKIEDLFLLGVKYSLLVGAPIYITYLIMGEHFITLWMGKEYSKQAETVLIILSLTHFFSMIHYTVHYVLLGISSHYIIAYLRILEAVINIVLSIILIKYYGIIGVALGTALPHLGFMVLLLSLIVCRHLQVEYFRFIRKSILKPILASCLFGVVCHMVQRYIPANNLIYFFAEILCIMPIYVIIVWLVALDSIEKSIIIRTISSWLLRFNKILLDAKNCMRKAMG